LVFLIFYPAGGHRQAVELVELCAAAAGHQGHLLAVEQAEAERQDQIEVTARLGRHPAGAASAELRPHGHQHRLDVAGQQRRLQAHQPLVVALVDRMQHRIGRGCSGDGQPLRRARLVAGLAPGLSLVQA
jgi:hypothetical protein